MKNLLFPTDFASTTNTTLLWVKYFAQKTGATITLLHVFQPIMPDSALSITGDPGLGLMATQEVEEIFRRRLESLATDLRNEGLQIRTDWRVGGVENNILEAAREQMADLIIMGRSELNTFFDRLAGSAVTDVANEARCPVLIVPNHTEVVTPLQIRKIIYAMQPQTTQSVVEVQTESLLKAFDAELDILSEDQLEHINADLIVLQIYPSEEGFLDKLFHTNHVAQLIEKSEIPVLVYHEK